MDKVLTLLSLQKQALKATSKAQLTHIILNETIKLIPYEQAIYWERTPMGLKARDVAGNAKIDPHSSFVIDLMKRIKAASLNMPLSDKTEDGAAAPDDEDIYFTALDDDGCEAVMILRDADGQVKGGVYVSRAQAFTKADRDILSELAAAYSAAMQLQDLKAYRHDGLFARVWHARKLRIGLLVVALIIMCVPVRMNVTAPMEIMPQDPALVTAPFDGQIARVLVDAGDRVKAGDVLLEMDDLGLQNDLDQLRTEIEVARKALARTRRESLMEPEKRGQIKTLENEIEVKQLELQYAQDKMRRSAVKAPQDGVAIFAAKNDLLGRPVTMGADLMTVASPAQAHVLINVPVKAMVLLREGADVSFYLDVAPFTAHNATVRHISYQARTVAGGGMAYAVRAEFTGDGARDLYRLGLKGTAKIHGPRHVLGYVLLRRPFIALRELLGV